LPADQETHSLLLHAYWAAKNQQGASRELEDVTKGFRGTPLSAFARGTELLVRGRAGDAAGELARAYELGGKAKVPPRELGHLALWTGRAHYLNGDLERAGQWLSRALERDPSQADAQFLLGQIAFENGQTEEMAARYQKSVDLDRSGNPAAWYFLGEFHAERKNPAAARSALETYVSGWPSGDFAGDARDLLAKLK
jgi:tetratricopeptide (TPR) repeat protein